MVKQLTKFVYLYSCSNNINLKDGQKISQNIDLFQVTKLMHTSFIL